MEPGRKIAHYEILGTVGRGGMGVVYRARDTKLGRVVALKFLPPGSSLDGQAKARFVREARAASSLDHPNICTIHDIAETDEGLLYIVMAYYEGRTLRERLEDEDFPVERCLAIGRQLAAALERAHGAGIIHRDLKPANVMIGDGDEVKLLDFGVAKLTSDEDLTATHGTVGTISYMSPEQLRGHDVDRRTDVWALGAVLYEMLGGRRPFEGDTGAAVITAILERTPDPLESLRPDLPAGVADLIRRCLETDRERRPASAAEVGRGLRIAGGTGEEDQATRTFVGQAPAARGGRRRAWSTAIAALVVAAVAVAAVIWTTSRRTEPLVFPFSDKVLAVLPFTVRGSPDLGYLGEGIVDLMSARLDGIGGVTTVDPRVVISRIREDGIDISSPDAGAVLASHVGAGRYVTGDLLEVGGRVTLTATLRVTGGDDTPPEKATVEGDAADVFHLIDGLVADLVTHSMSAPGDRLTRTAAMTSQSLEATKAYLLGEQMLRSGRYREAAEAYEAAVGFDPEFALAHYRKSVAADWIDAYDVRTSAERAYELEDRLPPRERSLLEALRLRRVGRNRDAEQAYRAILHRYPDDVEALTQLGEVLFHDNPRVGRSLFESADPFTRVLELEPVNANARIHLARLYALSDDLESLEATAERFVTDSAESERALEVESLYAFSVDDPSLQASVVERLASKPAPHVFYAAHGVERFARSAAGARRILDASTTDAALLFAIEAGLLVEQGRFEELEAFLAGIPENDSATWDLFRAFVMTSGSTTADPDAMSALASRLRDVTPEEILKTSWLPPYEDITPAVAEFERDYHVALLSIHTGRVDDAREVMAKMEAMGPFPGLGSAKRDALLGLEAEIQVQALNDDDALEALRAIEYEIPHAVTVLSFADGARSRFLRAEVERVSGDPQVAKAYYLGLDESWSWWDTGFRPRVYRGLAEIAKSEGRRDDALLHYRRLLELWQDCDPSLDFQKSDVEAALAALGG